MSLTITITLNEATYHDVPQAEVEEKARSVGHPDAAQAIAITIPRIRNTTTELSFEQRRAPGGGVEFRFEKGTLPLTLIQNVYFSSSLNDCERRIWRVHEDLHVHDNRGVMGQMEAALRADPQFKEILIDRPWYPRDQFGAVQGRINGRIGAIFLARTADAVQLRDTATEYQSVWRRAAACRPTGNP